MESFVMVIVLAATYFVEWIPNGATSQASTGEFPWQL
jgi:hypothetical protein